MEYVIKENDGRTKYNLDGNRVKKIIRILMGSKFYFDLSLSERHSLIRYILCKFPFSL